MIFLIIWFIAICSISFFLFRFWNETTKDTDRSYKRRLKSTMMIDESDCTLKVSGGIPHTFCDRPTKGVFRSREDDLLYYEDKGQFYKQRFIISGMCITFLTPCKISGREYMVSSKVYNN